MATPYSEVDNRFLEKIEDKMFFNMSNEDMQKTLDMYKVSAGIKFKQCPKIADRDDEARVYNQTLTDEEVEILALLMVVEWVRPRINSIEVLESTMSTRDYQTFSNANHMKALQTMIVNTLREVDRLIVSYTYSENDPNELGEG